MKFITPVMLAMVSALCLIAATPYTETTSIPGLLVAAFLMWMSGFCLAMTPN